MICVENSTANSVFDVQQVYYFLRVPSGEVIKENEKPANFFEFRHLVEIFTSWEVKQVSYSEREKVLF